MERRTSRGIILLSKTKFVRSIYLAAVIALLAPLLARADSLPSRDPYVVVPMLQAWHEHGSFARLESILGKPDEESIGGFSITRFRLTDGTSIYVESTPAHNRIFTINRSAPGELANRLYEPLYGDLRHSPPSSESF